VIDGYEQECLREAGQSTLAGEDHADDAPSALASRLASEENRLAVGARLAWVQYVRRELREIAERRPAGR
jgi:hypothetical protein